MNNQEYYKGKQVFIAWINFQRRAFSMSTFFKYELIFNKSYFINKRLKILNYIINSIKTCFQVYFNSPDILWIQLPPTPLLSVALFCRFFKKDIIIIADCHNGLFGKKWSKYLHKPSSLNQVDLIIVHNKVIRDIAINLGVEESKLYVLETKPAYKNIFAKSTFSLNISSPWILMPCAFALDEPIDVVLDAARQIPNITFVISGDVDKAKGKHDLSNIPSNVILTGYLTIDDYESLFLKADAILGLTTEHHVQLSVANEATGFEKPMILSDTLLLRELFNKGAIYVNTTDATSIASGVVKAILAKDELTEQVIVLKNERNLKWNNQANILSRAISDLLNN